MVRERRPERNPMAGAVAAFLVVTLLFCLAYPITATVYTVGDSKGWSTGVDYNSWVTGKTFVVGDRLVFNYVGGAHTVTEVTASDYNSCSGSNALSTDSSGSTTVTLKTAGTHYFICTLPGHCAGGMRLAVPIKATSSSSSGTTPATTGGTTPATAGGTTALSGLHRVSPTALAGVAVLLKLTLF